MKQNDVQGKKRSNNNAMVLSNRKQARTLAIVIGVTIFAGGIIGKLIDKLF